MKLIVVMKLLSLHNLLPKTLVQLLAKMSNPVALRLHSHLQLQLYL